MPLPEAVAGIRLGGPVSAEGVLAAVYDGLRLATLLLCVGAANTLANPKRLLQSMPAALHEIGVAVTVALSVAPQLIESGQRVRRARRLRGEPGRRFHVVREVALPVMTDALDRSLLLAAAMDSRGYGRVAARGRSTVAVTGALLLGGLVAIAIGSYGLLDSTAPRYLGLPMLLGGVAIGWAGVTLSGRRVERSRYRPDPWWIEEWGVSLVGVVGGGGDGRGEHRRPDRPPPVAPAAALAGAARRCRPPPCCSACCRRGSRRPSACRRRAPVAAVARRGSGRRDPLRARHDHLPRRAGAGAARRRPRRSPRASCAWWSGPTGSGKSTLLGAINGLVPHFTGGHLAGRVVVDGRDTRDHPPRDLADVVGMVGQDPLAGFVTDTVEEELAYAMEQLAVPEPVMRKRVEETLDLLGIAELRGRALRTLSGGQQQRVAIGSVLTAHPRILVLDEPTSALDPTAAEDVLAAVTRLVHDLGITVVMAEHRLERVVQYADSVVLLEDGSARLGRRRARWPRSPLAPPVVQLGRLAGWDPVPLSVRDARRQAAALRERLHPLVPAAARRRSPSRRRRQNPGSGSTGAGWSCATATSSRCAASTSQRAARRGRRGDGPQRLGQVVAAVGAAPRRAPPGRHGARRRRRSRRRAAVAGRRWCRRRRPTCSTWPPSTRSARRPTARPGAGPGTCRALADRIVPGLPGDHHPRDLSEGQRLGLVLAVQLTGVARGACCSTSRPAGLDHLVKERAHPAAARARRRRPRRRRRHPRRRVRGRRGRSRRRAGRGRGRRRRPDRRRGRGLAGVRAAGGQGAAPRPVAHRRRGRGRPGGSAGVTVTVAAATARCSGMAPRTAVALGGRVGRRAGHVRLAARHRPAGRVLPRARRARTCSRSCCRRSSPSSSPR